MSDNEQAEKTPDIEKAEGELAAKMRPKRKKPLGNIAYERKQIKKLMKEMK